MESKMQIGEYLGRCYYCDCNIYDYETRFIVHGELVCGACCVIEFPIPKNRTKGIDIRLSSDEDFADFLTFVQQDAYSYADGMKEKMDYPSGTTEWLKYFGEPSEDDQGLDEEEIMRLKRKDERRERQRMLKEERSWTRK